MAEQTPGELVMFTAEIGVVEINTLRDDLVVLVPADFTTKIAYNPDSTTTITLNRRDPE